MQTSLKVMTTHSLRCSWTSILDQSADGPLTAGLVM